MVECLGAFEEFYDLKTKNRKLTWIYSLGTCHLIGKFEAKDVELIVTTYQASTLLLFNNRSKGLSCPEIMTQLNMPEEDVIRLLHSLCDKYMILLKEPNTETTISPMDYFQFNPRFTSDISTIEIPPPPLPPVDEKKKLIEDVEKIGKYAIDASIVRIMKSRKVLHYQQLVTECVEQLEHRFKPQVTNIKKRIEDLISGDYLERDKLDPNLIKYLA
ncbi:hypothetical protein RIF29_00002 [Crotalaria pallida]|uniref:Cullin family profile domain-containing protein n=1 Tax=Crotalaria pallida TaxID=3830 RepID=A0AAN9P6E3_CROPI